MAFTRDAVERIGRFNNLIGDGASLRCKYIECPTKAHPPHSAALISRMSL